jgi:hypothetical protein
MFGINEQIIEQAQAALAENLNRKKFAGTII